MQGLKAWPREELGHEHFSGLRCHGSCTGVLADLPQDCVVTTVPVARFLTALPKASPVGPPSPSGACAVCLGWKQKAPGGSGGVSNWEKWSFRPLCPAFFSCSANVDTFRLAPVMGSCDGKMVSTWPDCGRQVFNPARMLLWGYFAGGHLQSVTLSKGDHL